MLAPDAVFLDLLHDVIRSEIDYCEVTPETLWIENTSGALVPNGFHREFLALQSSTGMPFVAHSVGYSLGSLAEDDAHLRERWLARMQQDQQLFGFEWLTDHLGASSLAGQHMALPLATPMTATHAAIVRSNLQRLQHVVPLVGFENSVFYHLHGDPLEEPAFIREILSAPGFHMLLDLHNVYAMSKNFGFDAKEYVRRLPLERVIEIHIAGGQESNPSWLPSGGTMRLDSHDNEVSEAVWELLEAVAPACPNLRGVTLERMEGTVSARDVAPIRDELRRAKRLLKNRDAAAPRLAPEIAVCAPFDVDEVLVPSIEERSQIRVWETLVAEAMRSDDPVAGFKEAASDARLCDALRDAASGVRADGVRLSALLVARLRFERLIQGCPEAAQWYEEDALGFTRAFREFHQQEPPRTGVSEAERFRAWWQTTVASC
jgi:uncharacterized protein (UPF0276 family)